MATPQINEFDIMRQRIRERELQRGKETSEAVKGQFASRGTLQSGAQIKAQERGREQVARQAQDERRDVLIAEAQINRAEREAAAQRAFQTQERLGAQQFATGERTGQEAFARAQAEAQRLFTSSERQALQSFQTKERLGSQAFTAEERAAAQKFQGIQAEAQRTLVKEEGAATRLQQQQQFSSTLAEQIAARQQNAAQFDAEMELNKKTIVINAVTALKNAGFAYNQIESLFRELGIQGFEGIANPGSLGTPGVAQPSQPVLPAPGPTTGEAAAIDQLMNMGNLPNITGLF